MISHSCGYGLGLVQICFSVGVQVHVRFWCVCHRFFVSGGVPQARLSSTIPRSGDYLRERLPYGPSLSPTRPSQWIEVVTRLARKGEKLGQTWSGPSPLG